MNINDAVIELLKAAVSNQNFHPLAPECWEELLDQIPAIKEKLSNQLFGKSGKKQRIL